MKRQGSLYDLIATEGSIYAAYLDARKNKRGTRSVLQFERRLGAQVADLAETLANGTYKPRGYNVFTVQTPKPRIISAPAFRDRVVQHAIYHQIRPIFDRTFIDQSFACRPGRGTHAAADYLQNAIRQAPRDSYCLQIDIRRFYYSIDHQILLRQIERKIKDRRLVGLMMQFAGAQSPGIPIGNLLSQLYALIYLNPLDHFVKRELKVRRYCRYVDDAALVGLTRAQALEYRGRISAFLNSELKLELSRASIIPVRRGLNFCGYRTWSTRRFVRRHALYTARRAARKGDLQALVSSLGHARRTASWQHLVRHTYQHNPRLYAELPVSHWRQ